MSNPIKGQTYSFYVTLTSQSNPLKHQLNPTIAVGDVRVTRDGTQANIETLPTKEPIANYPVKVTLSATETNADDVLVRFSDVAGDEWADLSVALKPQTSTSSLDVISPKNINEKRTFYTGREGDRSRSIVTLKQSATAGKVVTLAVEPALNDSDIDATQTHTVSIPGVTASNVRVGSEGKQIHFDVPTDTAVAEYDCTFEIATLDGQWLTLTGRLDFT